MTWLTVELWSREACKATFDCWYVAILATNLRSSSEICRRRHKESEMGHRVAVWAIILAADVTLASAFGCSDPPPAGAGGASGSAGAGTAGSGAGGAQTGGTGGALDAGGTGGKDAGAVDTACANLAHVACEKYSECLPWYIPLNFGDLATCETQYAKTLCSNRVGLAGSGDTPTQQDACAAARRSATCSEWLNNDLAVSACLPQPGAGATGSACGTASQCQSTNCQVANGMDCGSCGGPLTQAGGTCTSSGQCASNLQCIMGACGLPRGAGEACASTNACRFELTCLNGRCTPPAQAGESCTTTPCYSRGGLTCRSGVCEPYRFAGPSEACDLADGLFCRGAGFCKTDMISPRGTCLPASKEGQPCSDTNGPYCLPWASCVNGVCTIPNYGACK
jgi:hypothetical protein